MTSLTPNMSRSSSVASVASGFRTLQKTMDDLLLSFSESDGENFQAMKTIFTEPRLFAWDSEDYQLNLIEVFESVLYSDISKTFFAASNISDSRVLLSGDGFLTEEIILGHIEQPNWKFIDEPYVKAIMASSHLSEQIVKATLKEVNYKDSRLALEMTPNAMITPDVIHIWMSQTTGVLMRRLIPDWLSFTANCIRQAHPEYEGFPDEWVVRVFSGE